MRKKVQILENENRGLRTRISNTKQTQGNQAPQAARPKRIHSPEPQKSARQIGQVQTRILSLKQLKDTINDMYAQKEKFDKKCLDAKVPKETLEQYMYTYLN